MIKTNMKSSRGRLTPLAVAMSLSFPAASQTVGLAIKNGGISDSGGVPVVDIAVPTACGLSHNVWDNLNVGKQGIIFNNSQAEVNSILGGKVHGNANLSDSTAKVILNEVTSKNTTAINGMMEVVGNKADLIIANPNGISVSGGGSINTSKLTLTTGKPDIQNEKFAGHTINGGTISIENLNNASPTQILSRNVIVTGKVYADELNIIAGNNYINTDGQVTGSVPATGSRNTYSIDVAKLGGMYSNKISLVSTENGVGVRNLGIIAGGENGVSIDSKGQLINANARIESAGQINIKTSGSVNNTTGAIGSIGSISFDTNKSNIINSRAGDISTASDIYVNSGAIDNTNGKIAAGGILAVNTNNNTLTNSGKGSLVGIKAGVVALKTGALNNASGQIHGEYVGLEASSLNNNRGIIEAGGDIDVASIGNADNSRGLIRSAAGHVNIAAKGSVINGSTKTADTGSSDSLGIIANADVKVSANNISNVGGQIASNGDVTLESNGAVDNHSGKLLSSGKVVVKGGSFRNDYAGNSGKQGVYVSVNGNVTNYIGVVSAENGDVELNANYISNYGGLMMGKDISINSNAGFNNNTALLVADKKLTINTEDIENANGNNFGYYHGAYFGMPQQTGGMIGKEGIDISGRNIINTNSRIIAVNSPLNVEAKGYINNSHSLLVGGADASIKTGGAFYNNYATTYSAGSLIFDANYLQNYSSGSFVDNNATGIISSDGNLHLTVNDNTTNYGWISSKKNVILDIKKGTLYNRNTISAEQALSINAHGGIENFKDIAANEALTIDSQRHLLNYYNSNIAGNGITISVANDIYSLGNIASDKNLMVSAKGEITNRLNLIGNGRVSIAANSIDNNYSTIDSGGDLAISTNGSIENYRGVMRAQTGEVSILSSNGNVNNHSGKIRSAGNLTVKGNNLVNSYGLMNGYGDIDITLAGNFDSYRGTLTTQTGDIKLGANIINNNDSFIAGENVSIDEKSTVNNNTAFILANKALTVNALSDVSNRDGKIFNYYHGTYFGITDKVGGMIGKDGVYITGKNIYSNNSNIVAENSQLSLLSKGTFDNSRSMLISGANALIKVAGTFYNHYALIHSAGDITLTSTALENYSSGNMSNDTATGVIASDKNLQLSVDSTFTNYGWLSGKGDVNINVQKGTLYNRNTISAENALSVSAFNGVENLKDMVAGSDVKISSGANIKNHNHSNILGKNIDIDAISDIDNTGSIVSNSLLTVTTLGNLYNYLNILSYGFAKVAANNVTNSGKNAVLGGIYGLKLEANNTNNSGSVVGM
ncbi:filamentous hemagglutinin N-terminal domain-containing protein [Aeromonas veronii]|uniref:two-partner secretion domain-containing protein n=1 Tax=Aeromonas veronii TaxID=654 RepID=UPI0031FBC207